jgi:hypothetical protein
MAAPICAAPQCFRHVSLDLGMPMSPIFGFDTIGTSGECGYKSKRRQGLVAMMAARTNTAALVIAPGTSTNHYPRRERLASNGTKSISHSECKDHRKQAHAVSTVQWCRLG